VSQALAGVGIFGRTGSSGAGQAGIMAAGLSVEDDEAGKSVMVAGNRSIRPRLKG
jgi:hypothetical protein